jgi:hypothetical protein
MYDTPIHYRKAGPSVGQPNPPCGGPCEPTERSPSQLLNQFTHFGVLLKCSHPRCQRLSNKTLTASLEGLLYLCPMVLGEWLAHRGAQHSYHVLLKIKACLLPRGCTLSSARSHWMLAAMCLMKTTYDHGRFHLIAGGTGRCCVRPQASRSQC